jgi:type IV secretory pathway VirB2 component (pilin)
MENSLTVLFEVLLLFYAFDAYADATTDVICNSIRDIHRIGGPLFTVIIIGASLLAIFGRMPWPALFSLGVFVAVFFGAPQIVNKIIGKGICCPDEKKTLVNGKCVAAPGYEYIGRDRCSPITGGCCPEGWVLNSSGTCYRPGKDPLEPV